jgi:thiol-disulfide isomerase/thioredoxin
MKNILLATALFFLHQLSFAQNAPELLKNIYNAQRAIKTISYRLSRQDTFVTGDTRIVTGSAKILVNPEDKIFGFSYWGKRDDVNRETIYDGNTLLDVNHDKKNYKLTTNPAMFEHSIGQPGGQMIFTDLVKLDTAKAQRFELSQDTKYYYLTMHLPDKTEHDVRKRYKKFTIDKKLMLPVGMKNHQEVLGKVQDLNYTLSDIHINELPYAYNFSGQRFPANYVPPPAAENKPSPFLNKAAPLFELTSFSDKPVNLKLLEGKVVLLDFWEVWCGPCIASMPKVDSLYKEYKNKGLEVYGIVNDERQAESSKLFMQKRKIEFPSLIGNKTIKEAYAVDGIPYYVLINKQGIISFISYGYSDKLEDEIKKLL